MNTLFRISVLLISFLLLIVSGPAMAQRTGDGVVPAIETVCDDDPFNFGLCNAYCEALDCDSETPLGTPRACSNLLNNYLRHSDGVMPPCEQEVVSCPCEFDSAQGFVDLIDAAANADDPFTPDLDETTLETYCNFIGEPSVTYLVTEAREAEVPEVTPQGLKLFNWVSEESAACATLGGGFDGDNAPAAPGGLWSWGPFLEESIDLTEDEVAACQSALQQICDNL